MCLASLRRVLRSAAAYCSAYAQSNAQSQTALSLWSAGATDVHFAAMTREQTKMRTKHRMFLSVILLSALSAAPLRAQGDRGEITGTVTDATGAVIPGAQVTVLQVATNASFKAITSTAGDYTVGAAGWSL